MPIEAGSPLSEKMLKFYTPLFVKMDLEYLFVVLGWIAMAIIVRTVYVNTLLTVKATKIENLESQTREPAKLLFFSSTWCPWSKKARPQWDSLVSDMRAHPVTYGGTPVILEDIDGDSHKEMMEEYGVTGYPTFKLVTDTKTYDMVGTPTVDAFRKFLVKSLGPEEYTQLASGTS